MNGTNKPQFVNVLDPAYEVDVGLLPEEQEDSQEYRDPTLLPHVVDEESEAFVKENEIDLSKYDEGKAFRTTFMDIFPNFVNRVVSLFPAIAIGESRIVSSSMTKEDVEKYNLKVAEGQNSKMDFLAKHPVLGSVLHNNTMLSGVPASQIKKILTPGDQLQVMRDFAEMKLPTDEFSAGLLQMFQGKSKNPFKKVGYAVTGQGPQLLTAYASKFVPGGPAVAATTMGYSEGEALLSWFDEAKNADGSKAEIPAEIAMDAILAHSLISAPIEYAETLLFIHPTMQAKKKAAALAAMKGMAGGKFGKVLAGMGLRTAGEMSIEAVVEVTRSLIYNDAVRKANAATGSSIPEITPEDMASNALKAAEMAFWVAGGTETVGVAMQGTHLARASHKVSVEQKRRFRNAETEMVQIESKVRGETTEILADTPNDELFTRARAYEEGDVTFNLERELAWRTEDAGMTTREALIDILVDHDNAMLRAEQERTMELLDQGDLPMWEKLVLMYNQIGKGLNPVAAMAFEGIERSLHEQAVERGETTLDFDAYLARKYLGRGEAEAVETESQQADGGIEGDVVQETQEQAPAKVGDKVPRNDIDDDGYNDPAPSQKFLDTLPEGTQIVSSSGDVYQKDSEGVWYHRPDVDRDGNSKIRMLAGTGSNLGRSTILRVGYEEQVSVAEAPSPTAKAPTPSRTDVKLFQTSPGAQQFLNSRTDTSVFRDEKAQIKDLLTNTETALQPGAKERLEKHLTEIGSALPEADKDSIRQEFDNFLADLSEGVEEGKADTQRAVDEGNASLNQDAQGQPLYQTGRKLKSGSEIVNATVQFFSSGASYLQFMETGNFSSLVHEAGHILMLDLDTQQLQALIAEAREINPAIDSIKALEQALLFQQNPQHPNIKEDGTYKSDLRNLHEFLARSFEQYVREGKAPTYALRKQFKVMSKEMKNIYNKASSIPEVATRISPEVKGLFDARIAGTSQFTQGESMAITLNGKTYQAFFSRPRVKEHKELLMRVERGLTNIAGMPEEITTYAKNLLGEYVQVKTKKGITRKKNPLLKDKELLLRLEKLRTPEDAYATIDYVNRMYLKDQMRQKNAIVKKTKDVLKKVEWRKIPDDYQKKLLELIEDVDFSHHTNKKFSQLSRLRRFIQRSVESGEISEDLLAIPLDKLKELGRLSQTSIYDFTVDEVQTLHDSIVSLLQLQDLRTQLKLKKLNEFLISWADEISNELDVFEDKPDFAPLTKAKHKLSERRLGKMLANMGKLNSVNPENLFLYLASMEEDSAIYRIFSTMSKGGVIARTWHKQAREFAQSLVNKYDLTKLSPYTGEIGFSGKFNKQVPLQGITIRQQRMNPETGKLEYVEQYTVVPEGEEQSYSGTDNSTFQVKQGNKWVNVKQSEYQTLLNPASYIDSDFVYIEASVNGRQGVVAITPAQRMYLYLMSLNEKTRKKLLNSGFREKDNPTYHHVMTEEGLRKMIEGMPEIEFNIAHEMLNYFNRSENLETDVQLAINTLFNSFNFHSLTLEDFYFPSFVASKDTGQSSIYNKPELTANARAFVKNLTDRQGFLKERTGSDAALWNMDIFEAFCLHMEGASRYLGYAKPLHIAKAVLIGNQDVADSPASKISRKWGPEVLRYFETWIDHIEDDSYTKDEDAKFIRALSENQTRAVLGAHVVLGLTQKVSAMYMSADGVTEANIAKAMALNAFKPRHSKEEMMQLHPDIYERYLHGYNTELSDLKNHSMAKMFWSKDTTVMDDIGRLSSIEDVKKLSGKILRDKALGLLYYNDLAALSTIYDAWIMQINKTHPQLTDGERHSLIVENLRRTVRRTQPDYLIENMSPTLSSRDTFTRIFIAKFLNQRMKLMNERTRLNRELAKNYRNAETAAEKSRLLGKYLISKFKIEVLGNLVISMMKQGAYDLARDPDDERDDYWKRVLIQTFGMNLGTRHPLGRIISLMVDFAAFPRSPATAGDLIDSTLTELSKAAGYTAGALAEGDLEKAVTWGFLASEVAGGAMTGVPLRNMDRNFRMAFRIADTLFEEGASLLDVYKTRNVEPLAERRRKIEAMKQGESQ